jgi:hypothetical protein
MAADHRLAQMFEIVSYSESELGAVEIGTRTWPLGCS